MLICTATQGEPVYDFNDHEAFRIPQAVSATRQQLPLTESPSSVTIIDRQMIERLPVLDVAEILKMAPGVQVFLANSSLYGVTMHGHSNRYPRRLEIRVDGRTVYTPINSSVTWESLGLTPDDIDYIEVVRGSNIPAYGANAAQGAVNIVTRHPAKTSGTEVAAGAGDWQTRNLSLRHNLAGDYGDMVVRAAYEEDSGFTGLQDQSYIAHLAVQGNYTPNLSDTVDWELGYSDANYGYGDGDRPEDFTDEDAESGWFRLQWQRHLSGQQLALRVSGENASYERNLYTRLSDYTDLSPEELFDRYGARDYLLQFGEGAGLRRFQRFDLEFEHSLAAGDNQFLWGSGLRQNRIKANEEFQRDGYVDDTVLFLFANNQWRPSGLWGVNYGVLAESHEGMDPEVSQRLSVNFHPGADHHLRVSGSIAYRPPSLYEQHFVEQLELGGEIVDRTYFTSPDISPEEFRTYEFGYLGYWLDGDLSLDYRLFVEYLTDGIDYTRTPRSVDTGDLDGKHRELKNDLDWKLRGYDLQIKWQPASGWLLSLQHANVKADAYLETPAHDHNYSERIPDHTTSMLASRVFDSGFVASVAGYHQSFVDWRQGTEVESWTRFDLKLGKSWHWRQRRVDLSLIVQNLTGEDYLEYQNRNLFPRLVFLTARLRMP